MKYIGIILINIAFSAAGIFAAYSIKEKEIICDELLIMARTMKSNLRFSSGTYTGILNSLKQELILKHLDFINEISAEEPAVKTKLSLADDERTTHIFRLLGSVDSASMLDELDAYENYFAERKRYYSEKLKNRFKLYIMSGILCGAAVSIMLL